MDWDRVIYNGTVVNDDGMQRADIYIRDGRVAAVTSERLPCTGPDLRSQVNGEVFTRVDDSIRHPLLKTRRSISQLSRENSLLM